MAELGRTQRVAINAAPRRGTTPASVAGVAGLAVLAGALVGFGGRDGLVAGVGAVALPCLALLELETLLGLWLILALVDPVLPNVGGLASSDFVLIVAVVKLVYTRAILPRTPHRAGVILALAWLAEAVVTLFGHTVTSQNPRFLVTLGGLTLAVYVVWSSAKPAVWIRWVAAAAALAATLAVVQYATYRLAGVVIFPTAQNLFFVQTELANVFKATGLGIDPNFLGMWIVPGVGIAVVGLLRTKRRFEYGLFGLLCVLGILATGSRGSLLSAIVGGVIVVVVESASPRRAVSARMRRLSSVALALILLTPAAYVEVQHAIARYPVTVDTRVNQIPVVLHAAVNGNWAGMGFEAQAAQSSGIQSPFLQEENVVHNTLLEALYEAGWLGFLVPLAMLVSGLRVALRLLRGRSPSAAMLGGAFIVLAVNLQALGAYAFRPLWFIWALVLAVDVALARRTAAASRAAGAARLPAVAFGVARAPASPPA